ncbi:MAG: radical SAM protein [Bacteroidia bacterium]|nr:radical SAM protein [Bacteroidia bacterium]
MKIFLGDVVHDWGKISVWCIPLNIGLVASYVKKLYPEIEIRLFKHSEEIIQAIKADSPDIVALSYYAWNSNLDNLIFKRVKEINPRTLTVGGGPTFTDLNANEEGAKTFFEQQPYCDAYIINQGERGFGNLVGRFIEVQRDLHRFKSDPLDGCLINDTIKRGRILTGQPLEPLCSLDEIESPYLNGMMDPFLEQSLVPLLETNRNCPYECAYCAFGSTSKKLQLFSLDRVFSEIEYIAKNTTADYMITTDTNFGILKRDADIAEKIHENHMKYGFPGYLCVVWNKTNPGRVLEIAKKFKGLAMVGASMQSLNPDVLSIIKRRNLPLDDVVSMKNELHGMETKLFSELIS